LRGPNITVGSKGRAAECALLHAASLLRHGQADLALVLAGDTLTRTSYEWYESAGWLADDSGFIPSEGVTAVVLTAERTAHSYATLSPGQFASSPEPVSRGLGDAGGLLRLVLSLSPVKGPASLPTELP
jgi:3-oxoacyl-[acyl-carrier-protein] synthase III